MSTPVLAAAEVAFTTWARSLSPEDLPTTLLAHAPPCTTRGRQCYALKPQFPVLVVTARCSGAETVVPVTMSWPRAIRGRTRTLRRALDRVLAQTRAFGLQIQVDPGYPPSIRELTEERIVRLPLAPAAANSRADVLLLLQRLAGAIGLFVTRPRVYTELAWTQAGLGALAMLEALGVEIRWDDVTWSSERLWQALQPRPDARK